MGGLSSKKRSEAANSHSRLIEDSDGLEEFGAISPPRGSEVLTEPPYPKAVFYIVVTEACERFSYFGMKTILTFYLKFRLQYSEDASTVIYHTFSMLCFFTPVLGALLADLSLGRYRTILWVSLLYLAGNTVLSLSAVPPLIPTLEGQSVVAIIGLVLIAFGTGGIKPCVSAFGGDQFILPQQQRQLGQFFSIFYFSINLGALLSTIVTPLLRENTYCFQGQCYFAAFGLPAMLMAVALVVFASGSSTYKKLPASGTVLTSTASCIWMGLRGKVRSVCDKAAPRPPHWLDHARPKYGAVMVEEVRVFTSVLVLLLPLPFFWALFDQQGSRWTFQAARMDGKLGTITIQADQMQVLNPLLILLMVPCMERWGYPLLERCGWFTTPLQRVTGGGMMAALAFIAAALVESRMEYNASVEAPPLCMLWLLPQYILITMGEVLFSVSGLQFSFTEAPPNLKSVMQACWLLTISFGNLIVVLVAESRLLPSQTMEFALFACLMLLDMILFAILAYYYKPYRPIFQDTDDLNDKRNHYQNTDVMDMKGANGTDGGGLQRSVHPDDDPTRYAAPVKKERSFDSEESGVYDSSPCENEERRKVVSVNEKYTPSDSS